MTRTVSMIAFTIGMILAWGLPVMPVAAEPGFGWGTAELIETDDAGDVFNPQVAVDPQGNAVAVWAQSDGTRFNTWANRFVPGMGWGTAELIETDDAGTAFGAQVAVDPQGNAIAVWEQDDGTRFNIWANRFVPGVGWGTAELIETDNAGPSFNPQIAMDAAGSAMAVWYQSDGTGFSILANRFVPGVGWGTAELIENGAASAFGAEVAVAPQGDAVAVWTQFDPRASIWANRFVPGTGWGTAELIETDAGNAFQAHVAVDSQGSAVVVWDQNQFDGTHSNIWANRFVPGVGWGTAELIETDDAGDARDPHVAVAPEGNAIAVWEQDDGTGSNIWANRFVPGAGWDIAELVETEAGNAYRAHVAVAPEGNAVAVWDQFDGTRSNIWANLFVPGIGWGTAELIETDDAGDALGAEVAVDLLGNAVAVWAQFDSTRSNIWANRYAEDIVPPDLVITSPADGGTLPSTSVTVTGTASDDVGVDRIELSTDGMTWVLATGTTSWSATLTLSEGPNTISTRATDTSGNTATVSIAVRVDTVKPTALAGKDLTANAGDTVSFDAGASSDDVAIVSYEWDFGDETTGTGETTFHIYTDPGTYTVTLTVRDAAGNADTDSLTVTVVVPPGFEVSPMVLLVVGVGGGAAAAVAAFLLWRRRRG
ncbi:MAG: PKD domain-containing protein [Thermoplasmata archaeon]